MAKQLRDMSKAQRTRYQAKNKLKYERRKARARAITGGMDPNADETLEQMIARHMRERSAYERRQRDKTETVKAVLNELINENITGPGLERSALEQALEALKGGTPQ